MWDETCCSQEWDRVGPQATRAVVHLYGIMYGVGLQETAQLLPEASEGAAEQSGEILSKEDNKWDISSLKGDRRFMNILPRPPSHRHRHPLNCTWQSLVVPHVG